MARPHVAAPAWLDAADGSLRAGESLLAAGAVRSALSRFYYAAYQAGHALLLATPLQESLPGRGNWDHGAVANGVRAALVGFGGVGPRAADLYRLAFLRSLASRVSADYRPRTPLGADDALRARSAAIGLVRVARKAVRS